jgi:hypothetical protein
MVQKYVNEYDYVRLERLCMQYAKAIRTLQEQCASLQQEVEKARAEQAESLRQFVDTEDYGIQCCASFLKDVHRLIKKDRYIKLSVLQHILQQDNAFRLQDAKHQSITDLCVRSTCMQLIDLGLLDITSDDKVLYFCGTYGQDVPRVRNFLANEVGILISKLKQPRERR